MNQFKAIVASVLVTGLIAGVMVVIGGSALFSRPALNVSAASDAAVVSNHDIADASADTAQLRDLVNQYQAREQQLRAQLDDLNQLLDEQDQQLAQANQQLQQYQNLLQALQERGVIQITSDGRIRIRTR
jgi:septal ring factor EnvC (AmiA/AmiB activator)